MKLTTILSASFSFFVAAILTPPASGAEAETPKPSHVKVAAVQMLGYNKTDMPRPGFDLSQSVTRYIEKAPKDGAQRVAFPEYLLGRISMPGPETDRISKAAAAGRIYVIVGRSGPRLPSSCSALLNGMP